MTTLAKFWTGFMSDMPAQRLICVQNSCHLCPKSGLNLAKRWLFISVIQNTNVIVGLKLLTIGTNVTTVLCTQGKKSNLV